MIFTYWVTVATVLTFFSTLFGRNEVVNGTYVVVYFTADAFSK